MLWNDDHQLPYTPLFHKLIRHDRYEEKSPDCANSWIRRHDQHSYNTNLWVRVTSHQWKIVFIIIEWLVTESYPFIPNPGERVLWYKIGTDESSHLVRGWSIRLGGSIHCSMLQVGEGYHTWNTEVKQTRLLPITCSSHQHRSFSLSLSPLYLASPPINGFFVVRGISPLRANGNLGLYRKNAALKFKSIRSTSQTRLCSQG